MKMVFTDENRIIVSNIRNILENHGLKITVRNEFASSAMGEVSPFDTWLELWVDSDYDYKRAVAILEQNMQENEGSDWLCTVCHEQNEASFDICWNCQQPCP